MKENKKKSTKTHEKTNKINKYKINKYKKKNDKKN